MLSHTKQSHDGNADHTQMEHALNDLNPIAIQKSSSIIDLSNDMPFTTTTLTNARSSILTPLPIGSMLNRDRSLPIYEEFEDDDSPIPIPRVNSMRSSHFTTDKIPKTSILRSRLSQSVFPAIPSIIRRAISSTISDEYTEELHHKNAFSPFSPFSTQMSDIQEQSVIMELAELPPDFPRSSSRTNTKKRKSMSIMDSIRHKAKQFQSNRDRSTQSRISLSWFQKPKPVTPYVLHSQFVEPQSDDMLCNDRKDITKCNAIKRIIHALEYYKMHHMKLLNDETSVIPLYEYISSFKNYGISMLMEDWYRCKQNHIKRPKDIEYFQSIEAINCKSNASCIYVRRYHRHRDRSAARDYHVKNQETDAKNIILMDLLNSIHTFIFHWMPSRFRMTEMPSLSYDHDDEDSDESE
eukprot:991842_1